MKWEKCKLYKNKQVGMDSLRNPIYEKELVLETICRFTPWSDMQIHLEGREVTKNEQRFVIPLPFDDFPGCNYVEINGIMQKVTEATSLSPRYTSIQVSVYKE